MTVAEGFRPSGVLRFGVFVHGVNPDVVWRSPEAGSQVAFETYRRVAQTAERGGFAYFFLAEGLRRGGVTELTPIVPPLSEVYREVTA